jgi:hypothetical protein
MDGTNQEKRLREIEAWMHSSRREIDLTLEAAGIDPDAFRRLTLDQDTLRPELRRAHDEIVERLDAPPVSSRLAPPRGLRA